MFAYNVLAGDDSSLCVGISKLTGGTSTRARDAHVGACNAVATLGFLCHFHLYLSCMYAGVLTDQHAPNKFRVIGGLSQVPAFQEAFQCPAGAPMSPERRCTLW